MIKENAARLLSIISLFLFVIIFTLNATIFAGVISLSMYAALFIGVQIAFYSMIKDHPKNTLITLKSSYYSYLPSYLSAPCQRILIRRVNLSSPVILGRRNRK
ncbi:hypothetical protein [Evansella tamaricis]|uniref:Uncharacterized protein n=1 Tax=Evansella tamaricis TaxID=2069301 RepID=A0ABS6J945_9BACI|nr:hypothetical protein [Evansella tamaricis]MBU9710211.1 hypothetical protein [Evansella tamaricis]